jgi:membrane protein required for colicin V production
MTLFDYVVIAIVGLSLIIGVMRGAVKEVFSLASWIVAFIVAKTMSVAVAGIMESMIANPTLRLLVAFIGLFIVALIVMSLISMAINSLIKKIGLGPLDRVLGLLIGLVRGVVIMLILVLVGGMTALPQQTDWRHALTSPWFESLAQSVMPWLPDAMAKRIHFGAQKTSFK